jgi:hypothetical protein
MNGVDHAEISILKWLSTNPEAIPEDLYSVWNICPQCQAELEATGTIIIDANTAKWPTILQ